MIHLFGGLMDSEDLEHFKTHHEGGQVVFGDSSESSTSDQAKDGTEDSEFESITNRVQSTPKATTSTTTSKKSTKNKAPISTDDSDEEIEIAIQRLNKRAPSKDNTTPRKRKKLYRQVIYKTTTGKQKN